MPLNNLFIDFNSYFASVEQQIKPEFRKKPLGVLPVMAETTCCIAASYEAKAFGVKTGTMVSEAKKLCPNIKFVQANHRTYIEYHHKIVEKVNECLPVDNVLSIDEMVCSLIGKERIRENAIKIAQLIKEKIKNDIGEYIRCSIGIAPNQFLAKTGTNMQKPDGLVVLDEKNLPHSLYKIDLKDVYGVGRKMLIRLNRNEIYTMKNLLDANRITLQRIWGGIEGERMYDQLRGKFVQRPPTHRSTVGHSHVLPPKLKNNESAYAVLNRLLQKAAMRLRYLGYYAGAVGVIVRYKISLQSKVTNSLYPNIYQKDNSNYNMGNSKQIKWKKYSTFIHTQNTISLLETFSSIWEENPYLNKTYTPTAVAVVLFDLVHENYSTLPIFENFEKNKLLYGAIDSLNKRYGYSSIYFAGAHTAKNSAPMRIAFTQIPNLEIENDKKTL
ncbi:MAG: DNA polymerase [Ignavibacteriae bacterium]|nr:DNA polymerase [Ignavibacteriota bacterium]